MDSLTKEQAQKAFEAWNKEYTEHPERFVRKVIKGEEQSYAEGQTDLLFKYAK